MDVSDSSIPGQTEGPQTDAAVARAVAEVDAIAVAWDRAVAPGGQPARAAVEVEHG